MATSSSSSSADALEKHHPHEMDAGIKFYQQGHRYEVEADRRTRYTSVTTWVRTHFPKFDADAVIERMMHGKKWGPDNKYWGMTPGGIKAQWNASGAAAAGAGTKLHERIEHFMNNGILAEGYTHRDLLAEAGEIVAAEEAAYPNTRSRAAAAAAAATDGHATDGHATDGHATDGHATDGHATDGHATDGHADAAPEWDFFLDFVRQHPAMKPYRTEWVVYSLDMKIAGSIDMVYENPDGTLAIYDWKRSKEIAKTNDWGRTATSPGTEHIPDCNFWQYTLQLNLYRKIVELHYGKRVTKLCLVQLHPDHDQFEVHESPLLDDLMDTLLADRLTTAHK